MCLPTCQMRLWRPVFLTITRLCGRVLAALSSSPLHPYPKPLQPLGFTFLPPASLSCITQPVLFTCSYGSFLLDPLLDLTLSVFFSLPSSISLYLFFLSHSPISLSSQSILMAKFILDIPRCLWLNYFTYLQRNSHNKKPPQPYLGVVMFFSFSLTTYRLVQLTSAPILQKWTTISTTKVCYSL